MSVRPAGRLSDGGLAAACGILLALLLAGPSLAQPEKCVMRKGDDVAWSRPELDESAWTRVDARATWNEQGLRGHDGIVWFRCDVTLGEEARLAGRTGELGLLLGPPVYGGYEVFAGGRRIGRSRGWTSKLAFASPEVVRVPRAAIRSDGTVSVALRARRIGWLSDSDPDGGAVGGLLRFGAYPALVDRLRAWWADHLLGEVPLVVLAALFGFVCFHHLLLFSRRRKETTHLWFGLLSLAFAINTFASTFWIYELTVSRSIAVRLTDATGHLAAALAIQFLWSFFSRRVSPVLRAYQVSHLALAAFVALWPGIRPILASGTARWLWLIPLLLMASLLVLRAAWHGDLDARMIAGGGAIMIVVESAELARNIFGWTGPSVSTISPFGFAAVIVAMSVAISFRFRRVHDELDRLRFRLEDEVQERTRDLAQARDEALAADRAKSAFLANISHEIRTPLNGVIGMAELLACTPLSPEQKSQLSAIQGSGRSLLALFNDVLEFSRLESKGLSAAHSVPRAPAALPAPAGDASLRILLAEAVAINRFVMLGMLEHLGYRADTVTSGVELLEALDRKIYDVVLMDVQMPDLDVLETTRRIRSEKRDQPFIIAMTAHAQSGDSERFIAAGMDDSLSKPVELNVLQDILDRITRHRLAQHPA